MSRKPNEKMLENDKISSKCNVENVEILNSHKKYWNFKQKFWGMDHTQLNILESLNFSSHPLEEVEHVLHRFSMDPTDTVCKQKVTYGGGYWPHYHYVDGDKNICMDEPIQDRAKNECLIFSFVLRVNGNLKRLWIVWDVLSTYLIGVRNFLNKRTQYHFWKFRSCIWKEWN